MSERVKRISQTFFNIDVIIFFSNNAELTRLRNIYAIIIKRELLGRVPLLIIAPKTKIASIKKKKEDNINNFIGLRVSEDVRK